MTISIILSTKNEQDNVGNALKSIDEQTFDREKIEVIVVDNGSTDKTKEIAKKFGVPVYDYGPERSAQRNFGAQKSNGKYLFFMDADMILSPGVAAEAVNKFAEDNDLVGLYINERILGRGFLAKVRDFERKFYSMTVIDAVRFVRQDDFVRINGFDEGLTGPEDWDFDKRIRDLGKVDILKTVVYHNESEMSIRRMLKKKKYYMLGFKKYIKKWGRNNEDVKKQLGFWYRYIQVFFEKGKWRKVICHPILFLSAIFLKFLVGIIYLLNKKNEDKYFNACI